VKEHIFGMAAPRLTPGLPAICGSSCRRPQRDLPAPPPSWYIDALMQHEGRPYYAGLLEAAELHAARITPSWTSGRDGPAIAQDFSRAFVAHVPFPQGTGVRS